MNPRVLWANGAGEARLISLEDDAIAFLSAVPWPPGARVEGTALREGDGTSPASPGRGQHQDGTSPALPGRGQHQVEVPLRVKVHSSKRNADGEFLVRGRPLDLTRDARRALEVMLDLDLRRA